MSAVILRFRPCGRFSVHVVSQADGDWLVIARTRIGILPCMMLPCMTPAQPPPSINHECGNYDLSSLNSPAPP
jgi:hypothetical protein